MSKYGDELGHLAEKNDVIIVKSIYHSPALIRLSAWYCFRWVLFFELPEYQETALRIVASMIRQMHGIKNNMHHSTLQ